MGESGLPCLLIFASMEKRPALGSEVDERYFRVSESIRLSLCRRVVYSLTRSCTLLVRSDDCFW